MSNNCVLKNLSLAISMEGRMGASLGSMLGSMLEINSNFDSLDLRGSHLGLNGVKALLQPPTCHATDPPLNKSLTHLHMEGIGRKIGEAIADMLRTNNTLTQFNILEAYGLEPSDVCKILESLQKNQTLLSLGLPMCEGVKGPEVSTKMMDLFRMNHSLTDIDLTWTSLERSDVCKVLESLQKKSDFALPSPLRV
jgi:hypothetical protein